MPRKVMDDLVRRMIGDIQADYKPGDAYRTVREIAEEFSVSLQSAHRAVHRLEETGLIAVKPKSGITVLSSAPKGDTDKMTLLAVSGVPDRDFTSAFADGIRDRLKPLSGKTAVMKAAKGERDDYYPNSLEFADLIEREYIRHKASGICVSGLFRSPLPLYHLHMKGIPVVSNLVYPEAPVIPAVTLDIDKALENAADFFLERKKTELMTVSEWDVNNPRLQRLLQCFEKRNNRVIIKHITTQGPGAMQTLHRFFETFDRKRGVFVLDFVAGRFVLPYFPMNSIPLKDNLLLFDGDDEDVFFQGEGPVPSAAPSVRRQGWTMADRLIQRVESGRWEEPIIRYI